MQDFDIVYANGNEKEFIDMAECLGFSKIVLLTSDINYRFVVSNPKVLVQTAFLLKDQSQIVRARKNFDFIVATSERKFFEQKVDFIIDLEFSDRRDSFHYRNTSLNQVHAKLARDNGISLVFDFGTLLHYENSLRQMYLGRMLQNSMIARKYSINSFVFSLARSPLEMRSCDVLNALSEVLSLPPVTKTFI